MANYTRKSFLQNAEVINNRFLGMNNLPKIPRTASDEIYEIGTGYDERPDLLAYQIYGDSRLWWVFALRNPDLLKDPISDFKAGMKIILPSELAVRRVTGN
jgi:hypothetical protein